MKKLFIVLLLSFYSVLSFAQGKDVTKFLGIPVDGTKSEMIAKLKAKGFVNSDLQDCLEGEFNGYDVYVSVVTNNRKVWRIVLIDKTAVSESSIKDRFNELCRQFKENSKYVSLAEDDQTIPENENISDNMNVMNKKYQANFYQKMEEMDTVAIQSALQAKFLSKYTPEQLASMSEEDQAQLIKEVLKYGIDMCTKKSVWFSITEFVGNYRIAMYYDNKYNQANGSDL